jgi:hypothetical protein
MRIAFSRPGADYVASGKKYGWILSLVTSKIHEKGGGIFLKETQGSTFYSGTLKYPNCFSQAYRFRPLCVEC